MEKSFPKTENNYGVRCDQGYHGAYNTVVVHETQGSTIEGGIATLKSRSDGSAHIICGPSANGGFRRVKLAEYDRILCHTGGQNYKTVGVEKVGMSSWTKKFRMASKKERYNIALAAHTTANLLRHGKIPPRYLSIEDLKRVNDASGLKGWTYHRDCSYAFRTTTHTDPGIPGTSWPHVRFVDLVFYYYHNPTVDKPVSMRVVKRWKKGRGKAHE